VAEIQLVQFLRDKMKILEVIEPKDSMHGFDWAGHCKLFGLEETCSLAEQFVLHNYNLFESNSEATASSFLRLRQWSVNHPKIGNRYIAVMLMLINDKITHFRRICVGELVSHTNDSYQIKIKSGAIEELPIIRIAPVSHMVTMLFDNEDSYDALRSMLALQFDTILPAAPKE
jgi:hypothetical protein